MSRLRVESFSISIDGYGAGPNQSLENPLGVGGMAVHQWVFGTQSFQQMHGSGEGGSTGIDDQVAVHAVENIGACILGRNMFAPIRGQWPDDSWKGWWGPNPPYHVPVFVLTHHPRAPIEMEVGTVFHFVTDGIEAALQRAKQVAGDKDIRIGGGVSVMRQFLQARLLDELHLVVSLVLLGAGENLFSGLDLLALGYVCTESVAGTNATHIKVLR